MEREIVRIIKEICNEERISFNSFSSDYILRLEKNQRAMYIFGNKFPNNPAAIEQICNDKSALSDILAYNNVPHVEHFYFDAPYRKDYCPQKGNWIKMQKLLKKYPLGIVCKPNRGTGGRGVYRVFNNKELEYAVWNIFKESNSLCISPYYTINNEYRVLMVGEDVQYIFKKIRPYVIGDGIHTIEELWRSSTFKDIEIDSRLDLSVIPNEGEQIILAWRHNLGKGAIPQLETDTAIVAKLSELAKRCVAILNLGFVSIDIIESENELLVLEINSGVMVEKFATFSGEYRSLVKTGIAKAIQNYLHLDTKYYLTHNKRSRFVLPVLYKIAKKKGVQIIEDKEEKNFAIFVFPSGKCFVAKDYHFNINTCGSSSLSSNKSACNSFLKGFGYSVPKEKYFVRKPNIIISLNEIEKNLIDRSNSLQFDFPIIIKPNNLSQGVGVYIANTIEESLRYAQEAFLKSNIVLLQEYCQGDECRIVVLKGEIIQAYQRVPFSIVGNGSSTINELLKNKIEEFKTYKRDKDVDINDPRVFNHIRTAGYTLDSILECNKVLRLQDIANLSLGGTSIDVLGRIDNRIKCMAKEIASKLNLDLCGIDIIMKDISNIDAGYYILEVNSSPGLDNYLYNDRKKQNKYVESLYSKILDVMGD